MIDQCLIKEFWSWFQQNCDKLGDKYNNQKLIAELEMQIAKLGQFTWELGPGIKDDRNSSLVISPSGDPALLQDAREVVKNAPICSGWEFYHAKPSKKWNRKYIIRDGTTKAVSIDASGAKYVLHMYPDGVFDITIEDRKMAELPSIDRQTAAEVLIDGELGEEMRIALINNIDVVSRLSDELQKQSSDIANLSAHMRQLVG